MLNFATLGANAQTQAPAAPAREERPQAQVWLNIGMTVDLPNEKGESVPTFISLPVGIPVDTMEEVPLRGNNADWHNMVQAKNWLLSQLKEAGTALAPGKEEFIEGLQIQLRRVGKAEARPIGENPLLSAMAGRLSIVS